MTAEKVLNQARAWLGANEGDGSHRKIIDTYNSHKPLAQGYKMSYTESWCATFISAVAIACGCTDIIPTECSCQRQVNLFKNLGEWQEDENYTPNPGDIIYYDWQDSGKGDNTGWADHVGIVENVSDGIITVIEGNYNNMVGRRVIAVNGRYIRGYGCPRYEKENIKISESEENEVRYWKMKELPNDYRPAIEHLISKGYFKGKGGEGDERIIDLGEDAVRVFVINYRAGIYD